MKKVLLLCSVMPARLRFAILMAGGLSVVEASFSQTIFWTENFTTGGPGWTLANVLGLEGADPNFFQITANEGGVLPPGCGVANNGNNTMHVTSVFNPPGGAAYDAGGLCGILFCPETNRRAESPVINCTGYSTITLAFNYIGNGDALIDNASLWYYDGASWNLLNASLKSTICGSGQGRWTAYSILLPASANNNASVKIGFKWENNDDGVGTDPSFAVDEITLSVPGGAPPAASFSVTNTICPGQCVTFTDGSTGSPTSWSWTFPGGNPATSIAQNPANICYSTAGTYTATLTATNGNGSSSSSQTIAVNPLPIANGGSDVTICQSANTTLNSTGGGTYLWSPATGLSNPNISNPVASPTTSTNYSVTVTNSCGSSTDTINVTVNPLPTANAGADVTVCPSANTILTATGGGTYLWDTGQSTASITISPTSSTTYSVTVTDSCGSNTDAVNVVVSNNITASISGNTTICSGQSTTLTASGGNNYSWNTTSTIAAITVSPTANTSYTVYVTSGTCADTVSVTVNITSPPTASVSPNTTVCSGQTAILSASGGNNYSWNTGATTSSISITNICIGGTATATYTVMVSIGSCSDTATTILTTFCPNALSLSGNTSLCTGDATTLTASGGGNYSWSTGATGVSIIVSPPSNTTYTASLTDANGCSVTDTIAVAVSPPPTANIFGNTTICSGQNATLTASGGGNYLWNTGATTATINPSSAGTYSVIVSVGNCSDTTSATVTVNPNPTANTSGGTIICSGQTTTLTASGGGNYSWSPTIGLSCSNCQNPIANPTATTMYCATVTDANGCSDSSCAIVTVSTPSASAGNSVSIVQGNTATLTATGGGSYSWDNGATIQSITVTPNETTIYCVTITDANGCTASSCVTVFVDVNCLNAGELFLPNAFSPNGDGENDTLQIYYENFLCIKFLQIAIYNRWGNKVFETDKPDFKWDGNFGGKKLDSGAYTYFLHTTLNDGKESTKKGSINLIR